jgi:hypothetical protein
MNPARTRAKRRKARGEGRLSQHQPRESLRRLLLQRRDARE